MANGLNDVTQPVQQEDDPFKDLTPKKVLTDPKFFGLAPDVRRFILSRIDPGFKGLKKNEQDQALALGMDHWNQYFAPPPEPTLLEKVGTAVGGALKGAAKALGPPPSQLEFSMPEAPKAKLAPLEPPPAPEISISRETTISGMATPGETEKPKKEMSIGGYLAKLMDPTRGLGMVSMATGTPAGSLILPTGAAEKLPVAGMGVTAIKWADIVRAASRIRDGNAKEADWATIERFKKELDEDADTQRTWGTKVAEVLTDLPAFAGEITLTGGAYTLGKKLVTKALGELAERGVKRFAQRTAGAAVGAAIQTAAIPTRIVATGLENVAQQGAIPSAERAAPAGPVGTRSWREAFQKEIADTEDDYVTAFAQAAPEVYAEIFSEHAGGALTGIGKTRLGQKFLALPVVQKIAALKAATMNRWLGGKNKSAVDLIKNIRSAAAWNGVLGEMFEERVADIQHYVQQGLGLESDIGKQNPEMVKLVTGEGGRAKAFAEFMSQLSVEAAAFSVPGAAGNIIERLGRRAEQETARGPGRRMPPKLLTGEVAPPAVPGAHPALPGRERLALPAPPEEAAAPAQVPAQLALPPAPGAVTLPTGEPIVSRAGGIIPGEEGGLPPFRRMEATVPPGEGLQPKPITGEPVPESPRPLSEEDFNRMRERIRMFETGDLKQPRLDLEKIKLTFKLAMDREDWAELRRLRARLGVEQPGDRMLRAELEMRGLEAPPAETPEQRLQRQITEASQAVAPELKPWESKGPILTASVTPGHGLPKPPGLSEQRAAQQTFLTALGYTPEAPELQPLTVLGIPNRIVDQGIGTWGGQSESNYRVELTDPNATAGDAELVAALLGQGQEAVGVGFRAPDAPTHYGAYIKKPDGTSFTDQEFSALNAQGGSGYEVTGDGTQISVTNWGGDSPEAFDSDILSKLQALGRSPGDVTVFKGGSYLVTSENFDGIIQRERLQRSSTGRPDISDEVRGQFEGAFAKAHPAAAAVIRDQRSAKAAAAAVDRQELEGTPGPVDVPEVPGRDVGGLPGPPGDIGAEGALARPPGETGGLRLEGRVPGGGVEPTEALPPAAQRGVRDPRGLDRSLAAIKKQKPGQLMLGQTAAGYAVGMHMAEAPSVTVALSDGSRTTLRMTDRGGLMGRRFCAELLKDKGMQNLLALDAEIANDVREHLKSRYPDGDWDRAHFIGGQADPKIKGPQVSYASNFDGTRLFGVGGPCPISTNNLEVMDTVQCAREAGVVNESDAIELYAAMMLENQLHEHLHMQYRKDDDNFEDMISRLRWENRDFMSREYQKILDRMRIDGGKLVADIAVPYVKYANRVVAVYKGKGEKVDRALWKIAGPIDSNALDAEATGAKPGQVPAIISTNSIDKVVGPVRALPTVKMGEILDNAPGKNFDSIKRQLNQEAVRGGAVLSDYDIEQMLRHRTREADIRKRDYALKWIKPPRKELTNPTSEKACPMEEREGNLMRWLKRESGAGEARNKRAVFSTGKKTWDGKDLDIVVGDITVDDWINTRWAVLTPEERKASMNWYKDLRREFVRYFGEVNAEKEMMAWAASQANTSASGGMMNMLRARDIVKNWRGQKSAGIADRSIQAILRGEEIPKGFALKLLDFGDCVFETPNGKKKIYRTAMNNDPRGMKPFVIDIHTGHSMGFVSPKITGYVPMRFWVGNEQFMDDKVAKKVALQRGVAVEVKPGEEYVVAGKVFKDQGEAHAHAIATNQEVTPQQMWNPGIFESEYGERGLEFARTLKVDMEKGAVSEVQYQWATEKGNRFTDELNKRIFEGRDDWTPMEIQALDWTGWQKLIGKPPEFVADIFDKNIYAFPVTARFAEGSPLARTFPEFGRLSAPTQERVLRKVTEKILPKLAEECNVIPSDTAAVGSTLEVPPGGPSLFEKTERMPVGVIRVLGSPEGADSFANMVALAFNLPTITLDRFKKSGNRSAYMVMDKTRKYLGDEARQKEFMERLSDRLGVMASKFMPYMTRHGVGLKIVNTKGKWDERDAAAFKLASRKVFQEMGIPESAITRSLRNVDIRVYENRWQNEQEGNRGAAYRRILRQLGRESLAGSVDSLYGGLVRDSFAQAIESDADAKAELASTSPALEVEARGRKAELAPRHKEFTRNPYKRLGKITTAEEVGRGWISPDGVFYELDKFEGHSGDYAEGILDDTTLSLHASYPVRVGLLEALLERWVERHYEPASPSIIYVETKGPITEPQRRAIFEFVKAHPNDTFRWNCQRSGGRDLWGEGLRSLWAGITEAYVDDPGAAGNFVKSDRSLEPGPAGMLVNEAKTWGAEMLLVRDKISEEGKKVGATYVRLHDPEGNEITNFVPKPFRSTGYKHELESAREIGNTSRIDFVDQDGVILESRAFNAEAEAKEAQSLVKSPTAGEELEPDLEVEAVGEKVQPPQKTVRAYKLFRKDPRQPDKLFPLFVSANEEVPVGEWVAAEAAPQTETGKVKSKLGELAYRPGWHAADLPVATHIGSRSQPGHGKPDYRPDNQVWAEVELPDDVDWQRRADRAAKRTKAGQTIARTAQVAEIPSGGYYRYKTSPSMKGEWLIGGSMKVLRVLTDAEVVEINKAAGVSDLPRRDDLEVEARGRKGFMEPPPGEAVTRREGLPKELKWQDLGEVIDDWFSWVGGGWITTDGIPLSFTDYHYRSLSKATGIPEYEIIQTSTQKMISARYSLVRVRVGGLPWGNQRPGVELYRRPSDAQWREIAAMQKAMGTHVLFDLTDPATDQVVATGSGIDQMRAAVDRHFKEDNLEVEATGMKYPLVNYKKLGTKVELEDLITGDRYFGGFVAPDGRIFDVGVKTHAESLRGAYKLDVGKDWFYGTGWREAMRKSNLVRFSYYPTTIGGRPRIGRTIIEAHTLPTREQIVTLGRMAASNRGGDFIAELGYQQLPTYTWMDFVHGVNVKRGEEASLETPAEGVGELGLEPPPERRLINQLWEDKALTEEGLESEARGQRPLVAPPGAPPPPAQAGAAAAALPPPPGSDIISEMATDPKGLRGRSLRLAFRNMFTGKRDEMIALTNQVRDRLEKILPNVEDQKALLFFREFRNLPQHEILDLLNGTHPYYQEFADYLLDQGVSSNDILRRVAEAKTRIARLQPSFQRAMNPTPAMLQADALLSQFFREKLDEGIQSGFLHSSITPEEYSTHILISEFPADRGDTTPTNVSGGTMPKSMAFARKRTFGTMAKAIVFEKKPATLNVVDAMTVYGETHAKTFATRKFIETLQQNDILRWGVRRGNRSVTGNIPEDWIPYTKSAEQRLWQHPIDLVDPATGKPMPSHLSAFGPPKFVEALYPITDPNYFYQIQGTKTLWTYQAYLKAAELGLSIFHIKALGVSALKNMGPLQAMKAVQMSMQDQDFMDLEREAISFGMTSPILERQYEARKRMRINYLDPTFLDKVSELPVIEQVGWLAKQIAHFTFGIVQRKFKVADFAMKKASYLARHPNANPDSKEYKLAMNSIAKQLNGIYGGLHWENMGWNKSTTIAARAFLLAPDWTYSGIITAHQTLERGTEAGRASRIYWALSYGLGISLSALTSLMLCGDVADDLTKVKLGVDRDGKDVTTDLYFIGAPHRLNSLAKNVWEFGLIEGFWKTMGVIAGPILRYVIQTYQNKDWWGRDIVPKGSGILEGTLKSAWHAAQTLGPIPFSISTPISMYFDGIPRDPAEYFLAIAFAAKSAHTPPKGMKQLRTGYRKGELVPEKEPTEASLWSRIFGRRMTVPSVDSFRRLSLDAAISAYEAATPETRRQYMPLMAKKLPQLYRYTKREVREELEEKLIDLGLIKKSQGLPAPPP